MILRLWPAFAAAVAATGVGVALYLYGGPPTPYRDVRYYLKHAPDRQQRIAWCQTNPPPSALTALMQWRRKC
jgi:hypothetical protein